MVSVDTFRRDLFDVDALSHAELLTLCERLEVHARRLQVPGHRVIPRLSKEANPIALGATSLTNLLAERLHISRADARRRIDWAKDLGPRLTLSGEPLAPLLTQTADAQARGQIGAEHVATIAGSSTAFPMRWTSTRGRPPRRPWPAWRRH